MSKMDDLRTMREARYEQAAARATGPQAAPTQTKRATSPAAKIKPPAADQELPETRLCGHRAISGRTCTREHGHTAKSHRYS